MVNGAISAQQPLATEMTVRALNAIDQSIAHMSAFIREMMHRINVSMVVKIKERTPEDSLALSAHGNETTTTDKSIID